MIYRLLILTVVASALECPIFVCEELHVEICAIVSGRTVKVNKIGCPEDKACELSDIWSVYNETDENIQVLCKDSYLVSRSKYAYEMDPMLDNKKRRVLERHLSESNSLPVRGPEEILTYQEWEDYKTSVLAYSILYSTPDEFYEFEQNLMSFEVKLLETWKLTNSITSEEQNILEKEIKDYSERTNYDPNAQSQQSYSNNNSSSGTSYYKVLTFREWQDYKAKVIPYSKMYFTQQAFDEFEKNLMFFQVKLLKVWKLNGSITPEEQAILENELLEYMNRTNIKFDIEIKQPVGTDVQNSTEADNNTSGYSQSSDDDSSIEVNDSSNDESSSGINDSLNGESLSGISGSSNGESSNETNSSSNDKSSSETNASSNDESSPDTTSSSNNESSTNTTNSSNDESSHYTNGSQKDNNSSEISHSFNEDSNSHPNDTSNSTNESKNTNSTEQDTGLKDSLHQNSTGDIPSASNSTNTTDYGPPDSNNTNPTDGPSLHNTSSNPSNDSSSDSNSNTSEEDAKPIGPQILFIDHKAFCKYQENRNFKGVAMTKLCSDSSDCVLEDGTQTECVCGLDGNAYCQPDMFSSLFEMFWSDCVEKKSVDIDVYSIWKSSHDFYIPALTQISCTSDIFKEIGEATKFIEELDGGEVEGSLIIGLGLLLVAFIV